MLTTVDEKITAESYFSSYPESNLPTELIQGEIISMPAPSDEHQQISSQIHGLIWSIISPQKLGIVRHAPTDIEFDSLNVLQPDIFVVLPDNPNCYRTEDGKRWRGAPDLCVEIISPSSAKRDLQTKFDLYEQHGVREYWIIHPESRIIQQYHRHAVLNAEDTLTSAILPQLTFPLASIFEG